MLETIKNLLKIKSLWSMVAMGVFVFLTITHTISGEIAMATVTAIVTYYFTKKDEKE